MTKNNCIDIKKLRLGGLFDGKTRHQAGSVWDLNYICPTLDANGGGLHMPLIIVKKEIKNLY